MSETSYIDLPPIARQRLGINEAQKKVLVRLDLRPLDRTLTEAEAKRLRDDFYEAIQEGSAGQWTGRWPRFRPWPSAGTHHLGLTRR